MPEAVTTTRSIDQGCPRPPIRSRCLERLSSRYVWRCMAAALLVSVGDPHSIDNCQNSSLAGFRSRHRSSAGYRAAFQPIPTRSKAPLLSLAPRARSAPFVPLCPKVPDLLENQDRCRLLGRFSRAYAPWQAISSLSLLLNAVSLCRDLSRSQVLPGPWPLSTPYARGCPPDKPTW